MNKWVASIVAAAGVIVAVFIGTSEPDKKPDAAPAEIADPSSPQILPWVENDGKFGGPLLRRGSRYSPPQQFYYNPQYQPYYPPGDQLFQGNSLAPVENRGEEYRRWLKVSVRIRNGNISGSGTICYYNREKKTAYIVSCGHLFKGGEKTAEIHVFYKNKDKLPQVSKYNATVLTFSNAEDISFMSFQADWDIDEYFPIAGTDYQINKGQTYYSCGCDGAREVACYLMKASGMEGRNLVLTENGPRHGRSGGGLMTTDGYYIGICWGSTDPYNGTGKGLFVPLHRIHAYAKQSNLGWLLEVGKSNPASQAEARKLPVVGIDGRKLEVPPEFIPLP